MDKVDTKAFRTYMKAHCRNDALAERSFALLLPLIQSAESGSYPLSPPDALSKATIIKAIAASTCCICDDVRFIRSSEARMLTFENWWDVGDYATTIGDSLMGCRQEVLHSETMSEKKARKMLEVLQESFLNALLLQLQGSHMDVVAKMSPKAFKGVLATPALAAFYLVANAIFDDAKAVEEIGLLTKILPHVIPIGESWEAPRTWYVLTA